MKVWVTRSEPGATALAGALAGAGYEVLKAPVLKIGRQPFETPSGPFDFGIFLSVHGVRIAAASLKGSIGTLFAVGRRTRTALQRFGLDAGVPAVESSEGLLDALPDPAGKRVLVVTGSGGRTLLQEALEKRGAEVTRLDVYVRYPVAPEIETSNVDLIVVSSGDGFVQTARLWLAAGGAVDTPVLAPSPRVASLAPGLGMRCAHDCGGANAKAVLRTLWRRGFENRKGGD